MALCQKQFKKSLLTFEFVKNKKNLLILTKTNHKKYSYKDILNADIVITSFQFIYNINYYVNYGYFTNNTDSKYTKSWLQSIEND